MIDTDGQSEYLHYKSKLQKHHKKVLRSLKKSYPVTLKKIKNKSLATFGGALMLSGGIGSNFSLNKVNNQNQQASLAGNQSLKARNLEESQNILLNSGNELSEDTLAKLSLNLSQTYGLSFKSSIDGKKLNTNWGYFGQEQHLYRWPGDTLAAHVHELDHGIAPGKGAFGYFDNAEQEKYYIATQLHLIPEWNDNWSTLKPFFRYRKVLIYNPANNKAAIAVIGDAGPAKWTGKDFGGSPELMDHLDMYDGSQKSKALVLLLGGDDYENVPLGPINPVNGSNLISSIL